MELKQRPRTIVLSGICWLAAVLTVCGQSAGPEAKWRQVERETQGDLQKMLRAVEAAPELQQLRMPRSAAALTEALERAGRFRELGLSPREGAALVEAVYRKHGRPLSGEPQGQDVGPGPTSNAETPLRAGTEFEGLSGILLRWPFDWPDLRDEYAALVKAFAAAGVKVHVWSDNAKQRAAAEDYLLASGVPVSAVIWRVGNTDSIWMRDYGPQFLLTPDGRLGAVADFHYYRYRPNDDDTPLEVAASFGLPVVNRQTEDAVYTEGGNLGHDGLGSVIYSTRTYEKNRAPSSLVDARILSAFQASQAIVLQDPTLDSTGHIDMFLKILDEETILVGQYAAGQVDHAVLEEAALRLASLRNGAGKPFRIVRIPQPDVYYSQFVVPVVRTYTNAQMVNGVVVVPVYGIPSDDVALDTYRRLLPKHQVVGLNANDIIESGGAWHCVTMEVHGKPTH